MPASGTSALPIDTRIPSTAAWKAAGQRQSRAGVAERDDDVGRHRRQAEPRDQEAERAAGEAEHQRLQDVDGEDPPARRAQALERGDAGPLLLQEDARHAPHADAAEDEDHVADQAEEVLRALDLRADARLGVVVRAHRREAVAEASPQPLDDRLERRVGQLQQALVADPAAEADEAGRGEIGAIDDDAGAERERAGAAARLGADHAADLEAGLADEDRAADAHAELRDQIGAHQHAVAGDEGVAVGPPVLERERAVEGIGAVDGEQLDQPRRRRRRRRHAASSRSRRPRSAAAPPRAGLPRRRSQSSPDPMGASTG